MTYRVGRRARRRIRSRGLRRWGPRSVARRLLLHMMMWGAGVMMWVTRRMIRRMLRSAFCFGPALGGAC